MNGGLTMERTRTSEAVSITEAERRVAELLGALFGRKLRNVAGVSQSDVEDALIGTVLRVLEGGSDLPKTFADSIAQRIAEDRLLERLARYARVSVKNHAVSEHRRDRRIDRSIDVQSAPFTTGESTQATEAHVDANHMLGYLPQETRALVVGYFDGPEAFESARREMGLKPEAAKKRVQRAIEELRRLAGVTERAS
jgi:DNA-directed RNA polymerase specialized sigma24 family protein